jgi:transcription initiation factor TFIIB
VAKHDWGGLLVDTEIEIKKCSECGCRTFDECNKTGYESCGNCGLIYNAMVIDEGPDWRTYSDTPDGERQDRTGMPSTELLHDKGLTTDIGWQNRDYAGAGMSSNNSKLFRRLRRQHQRTRISNSTERNLAVALGELQRLASRMGLPKQVREEAAYIYRKAVEKKLVRGRSIEGVVAASLYAACRIQNVPRTLDEVGKYSRTGRKEIGRTFRAIAMELLLRVPPARPSDYVPRFCALLKLPIAAQSESLRILELAEQHDLTAGRGPTGIAAASVYLASIMTNNQRTQREVSDAAGVTEVTIRNRYKEICESLNIDPNA